MKVKDLKIGETLYAYNDKVLEHKVIEVQTLETEDHKEKFWILECQSCTDHTKCRFATKLDDYGNLVYSHMVNNYQEEDEESGRCKNSQYYWQSGSVFFKTRTEARLYVHHKNIDYYKSNIKKAEDSIEYNKKCIEESEEKIKALNEQKEEIDTLNKHNQ